MQNFLSINGHQMINSGIYRIINTIDFKIYIGSAVWFNQRWRVHKSDLNLNKHGSIRLQRAWNKYGCDTFKFEILERVFDESKLIEREQFWLDRLNSYIPELGYNILQTAGSRLGFKHTEEFKIKRSEQYKGRKLPEEQIIKIANANRGQKRNPEQLARMSQAQKNNLSIRRPDRWPHGYGCKCEPCKTTMREYKRNIRKNKKLKIQVLDGYCLNE